MALALASVIYARMPRLYNASTLVSDETQEMTIAVGISSYLEREEDSKLDDPNVYAKILDSPDFIDAVCRIPVGRSTYGRHLEEQAGDARADAFERYFKHSEDRRARTVEISVFDRNPKVAALVADSAVALLEHRIRVKKNIVVAAQERHLDAECAKAHATADSARVAYAEYFDSHRDAVAPKVLAEIDRLKKAADQAYKEYSTLSRKHMRARLLMQQSEPSFTVIRRATVPHEPVSPQPFVVFGAALIIGLVVGWWANLLRHRIVLRDWHFSLGGWFSPWSITLLVWAAILVLIRLEGKLLYPLTEQFYTALALWVPALCITAFVTYTLMEKSTPTDTKQESNELVFNVLLALSIVMTPLYAWNVYQVVSQFSADDMLNNIRLLANEGEGQGALKYAIVINQSLLVVALWRYPLIKTWKLVVVILSCLLGAIAIMEKGSILFVLLMCIFVMYERRVVRLHTIVTLACVAVVGFYFFNLARETEEYAENETFLDFVATYLASPAVAFSRLSADLTPQVGTNTFEVFYTILDKLGWGNYVVHEKLQDFVWVPMPTNVYTIMQPFFIDFGYAGVAFFGALYGVIFGALYSGYQNGRSFSRAFYSYGVYILVLQFYQDNFMLSLSYNIQMCILFLVLTQGNVRSKSCNSH